MNSYFTGAQNYEITILVQLAERDVGLGTAGERVCGAIRVGVTLAYCLSHWERY